MPAKPTVKWSSLLIWIPLVLMLVAGIGAVVRLQVMADDKNTHLTREELQREYVPREEIDHRLDAQDMMLDRIYDKTEAIEQHLRTR